LNGNNKTSEMKKIKAKSDRLKSYLFGFVSLVLISGFISGFVSCKVLRCDKEKRKDKNPKYKEQPALYGPPSSIYQEEKKS